MKPALYYALFPGWSGLSSFGRIMVVTSEKGPQLYGRDYECGNPTHRCNRDLIAKFPDEKAILQAVEDIKELEKSYERPIQEAKLKVKAIENELRWKRKEILYPDQSQLVSRA